MCHFITLIAPSDDDVALKEMLRSHGRNATPIDNPSIRAVLESNEYQYLTTNGHCDCGTIFDTHESTLEDEENETRKEIVRMKRKGWSEAKIRRAMNDRSKSRLRRNHTGPDDYELWTNVLTDIKEKLKLPYVGLFVRFYSGSISTEEFKASRRSIPKNTKILTALQSMKSDEVTIFF